MEDEYNKNAKKLDKIYKAKLNELKNRIKNQEDLRLMKINQNSRNLKKVLEKTDQRMNRIDQLIATGEEVIRESYLAIDEITKKGVNWVLQLKFMIKRYSCLITS